jgi:PAS domain S-box-containing protein
MLGFDREEFAPTLDAFTQLLHPEQKKTFLSDRIQFYKGNLPDDVYEKELLLLTKNNGYQWFEAKSKLIRINQKKAILEIGVLRSIHTKKMAEEAIREGEQTLRYISYASKDGIYDVDLLNYEARFSENYYLLLGYSPKEIAFTWQNWTDFIHPEDRNAFLDAYNRFLLKKLNAFSKECRMLCQDGNYRWVLNRAKMVQFDEYGVPVRLIGTLTNIQKIKEAEDQLRQAFTDIKVSKENLHQYAEELETTLEQLRQMQEQLVQAEKMASLGVLVAGIAHELNNPIGYIYSSTEGLKSNIQDLLALIEEYEKIDHQNFQQQKQKIEQFKKEIFFSDIVTELQELINNIYLGANQTAEIVKGLRNFSRSDDSILEPTNINETLDITLALLNNQLKNSVEIEKDYQDIPSIWAYPVKLSQVFMNLIINALHAIEAKGADWQGKITISTKKLEEGRIGVSISDNGIGISTEKQKRIFEPFFTDKEIGKGTGLGLSISLGIVESLSGKITVTSQEGIGSTFLVTLPCKQNGKTATRQ